MKCREPTCCFTEVQADDMSAVDAVVKADTKRTALLDECQKLEKEVEQGNSLNGERLKEVSTVFTALMSCMFTTTISFVCFCLTLMYRVKQI